MKGLLRLAIALALLWPVGCIVVGLVEFTLLPQPLYGARNKPKFEAFFESHGLDCVRVRIPELGIVDFPPTMTQPEIEEAVKEILSTHVKSVENASALVEWDVIDEDGGYSFYEIKFNSPHFMRIASIPAFTIFFAVLAIGGGSRWVAGGFKPR